MFGRIAHRYDLMNALMTFGMDSRWRAAAARAAQPAGGIALDLATGTGDLALALVGAGARRVAGVDFSLEMLARAQAKVAGSHDHQGRIGLLAGDALRLPFADEAFDCATNGFLLRNVVDLPATFSELWRVLKPGGRLVCLEITHPPAALAPLFRLYLEGAVPIVGGLVSGDPTAYRYLPASLRPFPDSRRLAELLRDAGFSDVHYRLLGLGTVALHVAIRPGSGDGERDPENG